MYCQVARYRGQIIDFYYDENNQKQIRYVSDLNLKLGVQTDEESEWKTLTGKNVKPYYFNSSTEYYKFIDDHQESLMIYGNIDPIYQYIHEKYSDMKVNFKNVKIYVIDIEVQADEGFPDPEETPKPITSITIKDIKNDRFYVCATKPYDKWKNELKIDPRKIHFFHASSEKRLYMWLISLMEKTLPDILIGWYSDNFDFPYIINRSYIVFEGEDVISRISPYGDVRCESNTNGDFGQRSFRTIIGGIYTLDYMKLYKKFLRFEVRESYSLDYISNVELGERKLQFEETNLTELWSNNPQKYIDYNIYDVELIALLNNKLNLIQLLATLAYKAKCNYHDALGTVRIWDVYIYNILQNQKIMIPPDEKKERGTYAGAYVKDPICDIHNWVISLDLNSLYPHLQQQFNISPECLVHDKKEDVSIDAIDTKLLNQTIKVDPNYILAGNGYYFRKDIEGFIPKILKDIYAERKEVKKEMLIKKQELVNLKEQYKLLEGEL